MPHTLSGKNTFSIIKSQWIMIWIRRRKPRLWKLSTVNSIQCWGWFLVSIRWMDPGSKRAKFKKIQQQRKVSLKVESQKEKDQKGYSEVDDLGCACWLKNTEIEFDVDLLRKGESDWIGRDLKLKERVSLWEKDVEILLDEFSVSQFRKTSTVVEKELSDSFGYNIEKVSELRSEAIFRWYFFAEVAF